MKNKRSNGMLTGAFASLAAGSIIRESEYSLAFFGIGLLLFAILAWESRKKDGTANS